METAVGRTPAVSRFQTGQGRVLYSFKVQAFKALVANIHVLEDGDRLFLIDTGSGTPESNRQLLDGFQAIERECGRRVDPAKFEAILITHGHIDHFGGLPFLRRFSHAPIGVHPLDRATLSHHEERAVVASRRLESFLASAGVAEEHRAELMQVYLWAKGFYRSVQTQFTLEEDQPNPASVEVIHVPGHCPGQVCLRVDDILLTADHVLSRITPHQAPESITASTGLGHYLDSLARIAKEDVRLGLGGHEDPIPDLPARIAAIRKSHDNRLDRTLEICREARTIQEISLELFGRVESYHVLLALEETGAHVEYLYQRGELAAANVEELQTAPQPVVRYQRI